MNLSNTLSTYLLIATPALLVLAVTGNQDNMLWGYIIGLILSLIKICLLFFEVDMIINTKVGTTDKNKFVFSKTYWINPILVAITYYITLRIFGLASMFACFAATMLLKPTYYILKNRKGGVR